MKKHFVGSRFLKDLLMCIVGEDSLRRDQCLISLYSNEYSELLSKGSILTANYSVNVQVMIASVTR